MKRKMKHVRFFWVASKLLSSVLLSIDHILSKKLIVRNVKSMFINFLFFEASLFVEVNVLFIFQSSKSTAFLHPLIVSNLLEITSNSTTKAKASSSCRAGSTTTRTTNACSTTTRTTNAYFSKSYSTFGKKFTNFVLFIENHD